MRAHISCTTIRASVIGIMVHSRRCPNCAPAWRVGQDAAGIIVDVRGNESRPDYGKEQQDPDLPTSQEPHAHFSLT